MSLKKLIPAVTAFFLAVSMPVLAEPKAGAEPKARAVKTYDEQAFLKLVGNKSRKQIVDMLGEPARKELSIKPANVVNTIGRPLGPPTQGGDKVEMWYYHNIVHYDNKNTYRTTELTFINGICRNVALFNTR